MLDVEGNATLCCASMASKANTIGNYLAMPIEEIQAARPVLIGNPVVAPDPRQAFSGTRA